MRDAPNRLARPSPPAARRRRPARGALPLYLKDHSWGEFVFDFALGRGLAARRPRLLPAAGRRRAIHAGDRARGCLRVGRSMTRARLLAAAQCADARELGCLRCTCSFPTRAIAQLLEAAGLSPRLDCQFHWRTKDTRTSTISWRASPPRSARRCGANGAASVKPASSAGRSQAANSTGRCSTSCIGCTPDLCPTRPCALPQPGVLRAPGRRRCRMRSSLNWRPLQASRSPARFRSEAPDTLYGRYWGASGDFHSLHFELCYYRGIEYCIRAAARSDSSRARRASTSCCAASCPTPVWSAARHRRPSLRRSRSGTGSSGSAPGGAPGSSMAATHLPFRRARSPLGSNRCPASPGCRRLTPPSALPPTSRALHEPNGLLAVGGDADTRMADSRLPPRHLSLVLGRAADPLVGARSARGAAAGGVPHLAQPRPLDARRGYETRVNTAFRGGDRGLRRDRAAACRAPGSPARCIAAYVVLHRRGLAHSFETWHEGRLVGGLYGVAHRPGVLRRIHVHARNGCLESRTRTAGRRMPARQRSADRLPDAKPASREPRQPQHSTLADFEPRNSPP